MSIKYVGRGKGCGGDHLPMNRTGRRRWRRWLDDPRCHYCRLFFRFEETTFDHIVPISRGGGDEDANLVIACCDCNVDKGDMWLEDYLAMIAQRIARAVGGIPDGEEKTSRHQGYAGG